MRACVSGVFTSDGRADIAQADTVRNIRIEPQDESSMVREVARPLIVALLMKLWSLALHHSSDTLSW